MRFSVMIAVAAMSGLLLACGGSGDGPDEPAPEPGISVTPMSAAPGEQVTVRARGFPANNTVRIGFGPPRSEYEVLRQEATDAAGAVSVSVRVPTWAETGRGYVWVVADRDNEPRVVSDTFRVVSD